MKSINHKELKYVLLENFRARKSIGVLGRTGIGKSWIVKEVGKEIAKQLNKEFVEWNELSFEKKREVIRNSNKYYVFVDIRLSQITPEDLRGLPFSSDGFVEWKPNLWALALSKCAGLLFFDEFNLALPSIQATIYQILLDRQIGEIALNKDVFIVLAGNLLEDNAGTYDIPKPIRTRISLYKLNVPSAEEWIEWGYKNDIDSRVLTYLNINQSKIFVENEDDVISPRGWHFVSDLIKDKENLEEIELLASGVLGEGIAIEFVAFLKLKDKIASAEEILNGKAEIQKDINLQYAVVTEIVEFIKKQKEKEKYMKKSVKLYDKFEHKEVFVWLLRLVKRIDEDEFRKSIGDKEMKILNQFAKFLIE